MPVEMLALMVAFEWPYCVRIFQGQIVDRQLQARVSTEPIASAPERRLWHGSRPRQGLEASKYTLKRIIKASSPTHRHRMCRIADKRVCAGSYVVVWKDPVVEVQLLHGCAVRDRIDEPTKWLRKTLGGLPEQSNALVVRGSGDPLCHTAERLLLSRP